MAHPLNQPCVTWLCESALNSSGADHHVTGDRQRLERQLPRNLGVTTCAIAGIEHATDQQQQQAQSSEDQYEVRTGRRELAFPISSCFRIRRTGWIVSWIWSWLFTVSRWWSFLDYLWWGCVVWVVIVYWGARLSTNSIYRCQVRVEFFTFSKSQSCHTGNRVTNSPWTIPFGSQDTFVIGGCFNGFSIWQRPDQSLDVSARLRFVSQDHINEVFVPGVFNSDNDVTGFPILVCHCILFGVGIIGDGAFFSVTVALDDLYRRIQQYDTSIPGWVDAFRGGDVEVLVVLIRGQELIVLTERDDTRAAFLPCVRVSVYLTDECISEFVGTGLFVGQDELNTVVTSWQVIEEVAATIIGRFTLDFFTILVVQHHGDAFEGLFVLVLNAVVIGINPDVVADRVVALGGIGIIWILILNWSTRSCTIGLNRCEVGVQLFTRSQSQRCRTSDRLTDRPGAVPFGSEHTIVIGGCFDGV